MTNLVGFVIGDNVAIDDIFNNNRLNGPGKYPNYTFDTAKTPVGVIVKVFDLSAHVRVNTEFLRDGDWYKHLQEIIVSVPLNRLTKIDDGSVPKPKPPYEVPEGGIDPNDPRLEWFWDVLSEHANGKNWCGVYDDVLRKFGLPDRKRKFNVKVDIGGLTIPINGVMARNVDDAMKIAEPIAREMLIKAAQDAQKEINNA